MSELWTVSVPSGRVSKTFGKPDRSVEGCSWSPDGKRLAFALSTDPRPKGLGTNDLYVLRISDGHLYPLVVQPGPNGSPVWSPDGSRIALLTAMGREDFFYRNVHIAVVPSGGGKPVDVTADFDESAYLIDWGPDGIFFNASQRTASHLFRLDPESGSVDRVTCPDGWTGGSFSFTSDFKTAAFLSADSKSLDEICVSDLHPFQPRPVTSMSTQVRQYTFGSRDLVRWTSSDGTEIEGVLYKPPRFNKRRKHPLLVLIHGGPAGVSRPTLDPLHGVYPVEHWLDRGAVILNPNYRGSTGYGEAFRSLNIRNLGMGDMEDVLSGVDHLIDEGFVDPKRMGAMGWSQGGFISAFLTTHTDRFRAISVGAGISNWV
ncbi:MAG: prolyl oligopeptidase family serine peptidase, partial [Candidatus Latescibacteria bacterium]|nr:prolyl oligopeptidase family serine peptidase [Candidatus Latescibacterota bacterium]